MILCAILLLLTFVTPGWGKEPEAFPDLNPNNPQELKEATRVLEEELKLAARPQTYLLIDLGASTIHIKGRGIGLHQIPIETWSAGPREALEGIHRLVARPPVVRRKIEPGAATEQEPISVADMPTDYLLFFTPSLSVTVVPSVASDSLFQSAVLLGKVGWHNVKNRVARFFGGQPAESSSYLRLTLTADHAQSLAWSLVDGMAIVIRRSSDK
ncbi:MAG: hypothetical protein JSS38_08050 [Nitrospira sp.]|nr:hypothetical protein [Nitrospira sp.]MBS0165473.1 hypothetical protein [Nitrospira sp.]